LGNGGVWLLFSSVTTLHFTFEYNSPVLDGDWSFPPLIAWRHVLRVHLICKEVSIGQNSTRENSTGQDKTILERDKEIILFMLENKKGILIFLIVCTPDKKLSHGFLARDKNSCFCPVSCYLSCPIP